MVAACPHPCRMLTQCYNVPVGPARLPAGRMGKLRMNASTFTGNVGRNVTVLSLFLGIAMILLPLALQADMMDGGAASMFIGAFLAICSLILLPFFTKRAAIMNAIHRGEGVLAWWRYDATAWEKEKKKQIGELGAMKIGGFVLAGVFVLIGLVIFLSEPDDMVPFLLFMLTIGAFFAALGQISPRIAAKRLENTEDEAVVHTDGLFYRGTLTSWGAMNRLEAVGWDPASQNMLVFCHQQFQRHGMRRHVLRIPIPLGQEQTAVSIIDHYNLPLSEKWQKYCGRARHQESGKP